ncbi:MAG TPA: hypothetical protein VHB30_05320 [Solirubrobacteraceae bacterium]|nr:hypothetical protein [Solirubrobacteraceae bacterium]
MPTWDDVRRIALALPGAVEEGTGFRVGGRRFAHQWRERVDPRRPKVPRAVVLVTWTDGEAEKRLLIEVEPDVFFTEPHYDGYPHVLVRLQAIDLGRLAELIEDAHRDATERPPPRPRRRRA